MNEQLRTPQGSPFPGPIEPVTATTQVADGFLRRAWTTDEVQQMVEAGILDVHERLELIGGELVAKMQKGIFHENLKRALNKVWGKIRPDHIEYSVESPLRLSPRDEPEPDFMVFQAAIPMQDVRGQDVLLVVEIADSSLAIDSSVKLRRYAAHGVREYWVVNARTRGTTVFTEPTQTGYADHQEIAADEPLIPTFVPELAVRLADLT